MKKGYLFFFLLILSVLFYFTGNNLKAAPLGAQLPEQTYTVTFIINDGEYPVEGAFVQLAGHGVQVSGPEGHAVFTGVAPGEDLSYTITKAGFFTHEGSLNLSDEDVVEPVILSPEAYPVTFTVTSQGNAVAGANVSLSGYGTLTTNEEGIVVFENVLPQASIPYTVSRPGFITGSGNASVVNGPVAVSVSLTMITYRVTFNVTDNNGPLQGAMVDLYGYGIQTTNDNGTVTFLNIPPQEQLGYSVIKGGYHTQNGHIDIVNSHVVINVEMVLKTYSVSFYVSDGSDPIEGATVAMGQLPPMYTGPEGMAVFEGILPGSFFQYNVTKDHYNTVSGHTTVLHENKWIDIQMVPVTYFELQVDLEGNGNTIPSPGTHTFAQGTTVILKAIPDDGWVFKKWVIDGSIVGSQNFQISMSGNRHAKAIFEEAPEEIYYQFTLEVIGEGEVTVSPQSQSGNYLAGTILTLMATPAEGHHLSKWIVGGSIISPSSQINVRMNHDIQVEAHFGPGTSIKNPDNHKPFSLFPNPASRNVNVRFSHTLKDASLRLYNQTGSEVLHIPADTYPAGTTLTLDIAHLPTGIYIIRIYGDTIITSKMIIAH